MDDANAKGTASDQWCCCMETTADRLDGKVVRGFVRATKDSSDVTKHQHSTPADDGRDLAEVELTVIHEYTWRRSCEVEYLYWRC